MPDHIIKLTAFENRVLAHREVSVQAALETVAKQEAHKYAEQLAGKIIAQAREGRSTTVLPMDTEVLLATIFSAEGYMNAAQRFKYLADLTPEDPTPPEEPPFVDLIV